MLLINISRLVTIESGVIPDAAIQIEGKKIKWFGPQSQAPLDAESFDCKRSVVTPGLIDCHTHLVHAGSRQNEYALRAAGKNYLELAREGGGILSTVRATRAASFDQLYEESSFRLEEAVCFGATTVEIKTGYGLDTETELKMLKVIQKLQKNFPITIVPTFLGAHTFPEEFKKDRDGYVRLIIDEMLPAVAALGIVKFCDCFVEHEAFSPDEAIQIMEAAKKQGMGCKLHVDQLSAGKGAELAGQLGAVSADHLENISEKGIRALKNSGTVAVMLPGASVFLGMKTAPARKLLDAGVPVAIATDYNPGTNPCLNLMLTATLGASQLKMTLEEVWRAMTINAAKALGMAPETGSIAAGKRADLILWKAPDEFFPLYRYGRNCVRTIFAKGRKISE